MFVVESGNRIDMHRGDTGIIGITATGYTFGADDRVLFTMKDSSGTIVMEGVYAMTNNRFEIEFKNADTDYLDPGTYEWDLRYIVNPVMDSSGKPIDGDGVATPSDPMLLNLRRTIGQI